MRAHKFLLTLNQYQLSMPMAFAKIKLNWFGKNDPIRKQMENETKFKQIAMLTLTVDQIGSLFGSKLNIDHRTIDKKQIAFMN